MAFVSGPIKALNGMSVFYRSQSNQCTNQLYNWCRAAAPIIPGSSISEA